MNFSTPFTCTEIIAHMKTLKYLALASKKISVGAEDNTKMFLILRGESWEPRSRQTSSWW